jgi:hypothetical protein
MGKGWPFHETKHEEEDGHNDGIFDNAAAPGGGVNQEVQPAESAGTREAGDSFGHTAASCEPTPPPPPPPPPPAPMSPHPTPEMALYFLALCKIISINKYSYSKKIRQTVG